MSEDEEIMEMMSDKLDEYYDTLAAEFSFKDIEEEMTTTVINTLGMDKSEAYKFVCNWFNKRH